MSAGTSASPLRRFQAQLDALRSSGVPAMDEVGRLLVELAADEDYLGTAGMW